MKLSKTTLFCLSLLILLPTITFGATPQYTPLVGIGINPNTDFEGFINTLYYMSIGIAALLAVIKIVIAGVKYMLSEVVTNKSEAKKDIRTALVGLLIVMSAVLILNIINPQLTNIGFNPNQVQTVTPNSVVPGTGGGAPTPTMKIYNCSTPSCTNEINSCQTTGGTHIIKVKNTRAPNPVKTLYCTPPAP